MTCSFSAYITSDYDEKLGKLYTTNHLSSSTGKERIMSKNGDFNTPSIVHKIEIEARKTAKITGVKDVRSFDEQELFLETELGICIMRGTELHVGQLSIEKGEVEVEGRIDSILYTEAKGKTKSGESYLARLFR